LKPRGPPTKPQIEELIDSFHTPQEKLAAELGAFAGIRWRMIPSLSWSLNFSDCMGLPDGFVAKPARTPVKVRLLRRVGQMRLPHFTFLPEQGLRHLHETYLQVKDKVGEPTAHTLLPLGTQAIHEIPEKLRRRGLKTTDLRHYFVYSLVRGMYRGETDLTDEGLRFMLGYPPRQKDWRPDEGRLREGYRKLEQAYFTTISQSKSEERNDLDRTFLKGTYELIKGIKKD